MKKQRWHTWPIHLVIATVGTMAVGFVSAPIYGAVVWGSYYLLREIEQQAMKRKRGGPNYRIPWLYASLDALSGIVGAVVTAWWMASV